MPDLIARPEPIQLLRDFLSESAGPDEFEPALPAVNELMRAGWLLREPTASDLAAVTDLIVAMYNDGVPSDAYPQAILWALRSTAAIAPDEELDAALASWLTWEEGEHLGFRMDYLPDIADFPAGVLNRPHLT
jgi:hypothetical protein